MKLAKFLVSVYESGALVFAVGSHYAVNETTERHIALGNAEEVEADIDPAATEKLAKKAAAALEKAEASARQAQADADAAQAASQLHAEAMAVADLLVAENAPSNATIDQNLVSHAEEIDTVFSSPTKEYEMGMPDTPSAAAAPDADANATQAAN